ncbi:MAG: heavy metal translocating P-type ATPase [Armatimonadota bacterium]|nr:heavy metal translocating P-type ATPase [Armatimonadota bacterium]
MEEHHVHHRPDHGQTPPAAAGQPDHAAHDKHAGHSPQMFRDRFWLSVLLGVPILYFDAHIQEWFGYRAAQVPGAEWAQPVLGTVLYLYGGGVFVQGGLRELRARQPGMMTLVGLAISVAFAYSLGVSAGLLRGIPLYWELATLVVVMLLGHWIEMASVQGAGRALEYLAALLPAHAHRIVDGDTEDVPVGALRVGDRVLVRPGEQVPADGIVVEGASSVNEAFLTGESRPVTKEPGAEVISGAINGEGTLTVEVRRTGEATTLSQIQRLVEQAQRSRSRYQVLADRAAYWLTLIALGGGALTLAAWLLVGSAPEFALTRMVAVMVIACPHALGLAIPLVVMNATALSARNGILVRNREAFERARDIRTVAFDKTGTLTEGRFRVRRIYTDGVGEDDALAIAAALESLSEHGLARAVLNEARGRGVPVGRGADFRAIPGKGIEGRVDGRPYRVGRPEWADEMGLGLGALRGGLDEASGRGESVIALMDERRVLALFALADRVRDGARRAVRELKDMGRQVVMVTGDAEAVARTVAAELGIDTYHARVLPEDKSRIVAQMRQRGPVAFVGDGINDAPALAASDLGIAIGAGANVAIESADLVLVEDDPLDVVRALRLAEGTYAKMVQNLLWATGYNAVALPLAAGVAYRWGVLLSPAVGALLMSLSTVIVAANAMLLRRLHLT